MKSTHKPGGMEGGAVKMRGNQGNIPQVEAVEPSDQGQGGDDEGRGMSAEMWTKGRSSMGQTKFRDPGSLLPDLRWQ